MMKHRGSEKAGNGKRADRNEIKKMDKGNFGHIKRLIKTILEGKI